MVHARVQNFNTQRQTCSELARLAKASCSHPRVNTAAKNIAGSCGERKDLCELRAIYDAVRNGHPDVPGLGKGVKYMADPVNRDYWVAPHRLLEQCENGACAEDCDSQAMLVAALAASIGFTAGIRAWGARDGDGYSHVFAVAKYPKLPPADVRDGRVSMRDALNDDHFEGWKLLTLDTTVAKAHVGWQPPPGRVMTAWIYRD